MKRRIIVEDKINKKTKVLEVEVRDEKHLDALIKYPSHKQIPKKGKGSFKRNKRISEND